jgi:5-hydroxyisourate hydrolase-like protein (transthyretin family)
MMKQISFILFLVGCLIFLGCQQKSRPEGFPKLYPCHIKVTQNGSPVSNVHITLYDPNVTDQWLVSGQTDRNGNADIRTHGSFSGAPAGNYKVVLVKTEKEGQGWDNPDSPTRKWVEDVKMFSLIDEKYTKQETTPLKLTIKTKGVAENFEIGPPVHILYETINQKNLK